MVLSKILLCALGLLGASVSAQNAAITYYGSNEDGVVVGDHNNRLVKYQSVAIPKNFPGLKSGDWVTIPIFKGKKLPGTSSGHSGCFKVDDTCPSAICTRNKYHFDIFIGNTRTNLRGMEAILDSTKKTAWKKGCTKAAMVASIVEHSADQFIDEDFDEEYFEDNLEVMEDEDFFADQIEENYFDEEVEVEEFHAIPRVHHHGDDEDFLN